jgi:hypothetical protein
MNVGGDGIEHRRINERLGEELLECELVAFGAGVVSGEQATTWLTEQVAQLEPGLVEFAVDDSDVRLPVSQATPRVERVVESG